MTETSPSKTAGFDQKQPSGLPLALTAYLIWGMMPLYLIVVKSVPAVELAGWRMLWTLPICLIIVLLRRQWAEVKTIASDWRMLRWLALSASLIATNWLVYVWAIQAGYVYATSLGYYINPLINVALGTLILKEKLSRLQWTAVGLAALGVALLAGGALTTLWVSLTLAFSFAFYGLVRKQVPVGALPGLTIEAALLMLPAAAIAAYYAVTSGSSFFIAPWLSLAIMAGGLLTATPLLLFTIAARRMNYSTIGFIQFLAPSIVFIIGLTVFEEPLQPVQAACFVCIWVAAGLFVWDLWKRSQAQPA
jgi:chloramphenicol-sensitive protein RarD